MRLIVDIATGESTSVPLTKKEIAASKAASQAEAEAQAAIVPQQITLRQLLIGLASDGWITTAEAEAWAARTALPANVEAVLSAMPEAERTAARITAYTMSAAYRDDPLLAAAAQAAMPNATAGQLQSALDAAFRNWNAL